MRRGILLGILISAAINQAQNVYDRAALWIRIDEAGRQNAFLSLRQQAEPQFAEAFAVAVGCTPRDLVREPGLNPAYRLEVNCAPPVTRNGLKRSFRWPVSRLNEVLAQAGIAEIDFYLSHSGRGSSGLSPAIESTQSMFGWSHHGTFAVHKMPDVSLESGFEQQAAWLLLAAAIATVLSPFLLLGVSGGLAAIVAGERWLVILAGTGWLWVVLYTDGPALVAAAVARLPGAPLGWAVAGIALPPVLAVWLASAILAPKYGRDLTPEKARLRQQSMFWGGIAGAGLIASLVALFAGDMMLPLAGLGMFLFLGGLLKRFLLARGSLTPLDAGPLKDRIDEIAAKAGVKIKSVRLIGGDFNTPAAFADHQGGILLSQALLRTLARSEVDAIVAHELAHLRRKHPAQMRWAFLGLPLVLTLGLAVPNFMLWATLLAPTGFLAFMALRRRQEFAADADAALWSGGPEPLIRGLVRTTQGSGAPLDWGRWVGLVLGHPPTAERFQALAVKAGAVPGQMSDWIAAADLPPADRYELAEGGEAAGQSEIARIRAQLKIVLGLQSLVYPVLYAVVAPLLIRFEGVPLPLLAVLLLGAGMIFYYLLYEWTAARARMRARHTMRGATGFFAGISPAAEPALYDGMFDFEWGLVRFAGNHLEIQGEHRTYTAQREEIGRIWLHDGPKSWTPKQMLCFELKGEVQRGFSIRPFDQSFGWMAPRAARKLYQAAMDWHNGTGAASSRNGSPLQEYPNPAGQPEPQFPMAQLIRLMGQVSMYAGAGSSVLHFYVMGEMGLASIFTSVCIACGLAVFMVWPALRRTSK